MYNLIKNKMKINDFQNDNCFLKKRLSIYWFAIGYYLINKNKAIDIFVLYFTKTVIKTLYHKSKI